MQAYKSRKSGPTTIASRSTSRRRTALPVFKRTSTRVIHNWQTSSKAWNASNIKFMAESTTCNSVSSGPEYAGGAFHARLHFHEPGHGRIFITVRAESAWHDFTLSKVASRATLYFTSEPALLDNFITDLAHLKAGEADEAFLSCT
jgi:hypothetical protein